MVIAGCDADTEDVITDPSVRHPIQTAADSAAFLARRGSRTDRATLQSHSGPGVPIHAGESAVMTIISAECASVGSVLTVSGALSGTISTNACFDVGASLTVGPAAADGFLSFTHDDPRFGPGSFMVTGSHPSFIVFMEDGFGDGDFNDSVIAVELRTGECQLAVNRLSQGNTDWAGDTYDQDPEDRTIQNLGCALTSLSVSLNFAGIENNPGDLNEFMIEDDGYNEQGWVRWDRTITERSDGTLKYNAVSANTVQELGATICSAGSPVILRVEYTDDCSGERCTHYVLATGFENGRIRIADPGFAGREFLDDPAYNNEFEPRGFVGDPPGDISSLTLDIPGAQLLVTDASGRKTGIDAATGEELEEIPQSAHYIDGIANDVTGEPATESTSSVYIFQPPEGTYTIVVTGLTQARRTLFISPYSQDRSAQPVLAAPVMLDVGSTSSFQLQFASSLPANMGETPYLL